MKLTNKNIGASVDDIRAFFDFGAPKIFIRAKKFKSLVEVGGAFDL